METKRLLIRPFIEEDYEDLYEYLSNPEVVLYEPYDVLTKVECIEEAKERAHAEEQRFWAVCLKDNNKMIGHLYFACVNPNFKTWTLGFVFNPNFYKKGYATEASKRMIQYGFEEKKAHRITAGSNVLNTASWQLLERLGMRREAHLLKHLYFKKTKDGQPIWIDAFQYAILAEEYHNK